MSRKTQAYGSWPSPIKADHVAAAGRRFSDLTRDPAHPDVLYWVESLPEAGGRSTIMCQQPGEQPVSLLPDPWSAGASVHEYGGGAFAVHDGVLWFVNATDQTIRQRRRDGRIELLTAVDDPAAYADLQYDARHDALIAVAEIPRDNAEPQAGIVRIDAVGTVTVLAEGHDFYASPRLSPAGDRLVWLAWQHPFMPWDQTELWQAAIEADGSVGTPQCLHAGTEESLFGPFFGADGGLHVVSDIDNWWNIHRETPSGALRQLTFEAAEFGLPQWVFGQSTCAVAADGTLYALATADGLWQLGRVEHTDGRFVPLKLDATHLEQLVATADGLALVMADAATGKHIVRVHTADGASPRIETVRAGVDLPSAATLSRPQPVAFVTADGDKAHALFYPPAHAEVTGPVDERPPLLIKCHGGPTGATSSALDVRIQYWTSRGYAVLDVNYRGSTGYGRAYRNKLLGAWGVADVEDCVHGAQYLSDRDLIDPDRVLISGSSAGGYTVLGVLTFTDVAAAGASYYGIGDLSGLLDSTHKFESRYLHRLIGDDPSVLDARSPLRHADQLNCPVLFLQGLQDKVVPPDQADAMVAALRERGVPVAHVTFANERHGFRDADNIRHAIEAERMFYTRVLGLRSEDADVALTIDNL